MQGKANPKAKTMRASKPRKPATTPKSPPKAGAKVKPAAEAKRGMGKTASRLIDERIRSLGGWRAETLLKVRRMIHEADPNIVEECKWIKPSNPLGVPVWSHAGIVCTGEAYQQVVKLTFARGASLADPHEIFNSSLDGNTRRAIDIREGEVLDVKAFKALILAAVAENLGSTGSCEHAKPGDAEGQGHLARHQATPAGHQSKFRPKAGGKAKAGSSDPVVLLSGGNPQIAKADGDAPVQAYIAAMPGWKRDIGKHLDALIERNVPNARKAVRWNSPFYGIEGQGWFLSFHVFTHYVKVTFFRGTSLRPVPPGASKHKEVRYIDIHEDDLDQARMATWVKQAAAFPGWVP